MKKDNYSKIIIKILNFLNYNEIQNYNGANLLRTNKIDFWLLLGYIMLSGISLKDVGLLVFLINLLVFFRMTASSFRQIMTIKQIYSQAYTKIPDFSMWPGYFIVWLVEFVVLVALAIWFLILSISGQDCVALFCKLMAGLVLFYTLLEGLIVIHVSLYDAQFNINSSQQ